MRILQEESLRVVPGIEIGHEKLFCKPLSIRGYAKKTLNSNLEL